MKPTYVMSITVGGPVTKADLENAIAKLTSRWGERSIIQTSIHKARARRMAGVLASEAFTTNHEPEQS